MIIASITQRAKIQFILKNHRFDKMSLIIVKHQHKFLEITIQKFK